MPLRVIRELLDSAGGDLDRLRGLARPATCSSPARSLRSASARRRGDPGAVRDPRARPAAALRARGADARRGRLLDHRHADHRGGRPLPRGGLERDNRLRRPRRRPADERARAGDRRRARAAGRALLGSGRRPRRGHHRGRRLAVPGPDRRPAREAPDDRARTGPQLGRGGRSAGGAARRARRRARSPARSRAPRGPCRSAIVHSCEESQSASRVSGGSPPRRRIRHTPSEPAATAAASGAGTDRVGGSTPWVRSSSEMNSRKTTGSPSVTKYASPPRPRSAASTSPSTTLSMWVVAVRWPPPPIQANRPALTASTIAGSRVVSPGPQTSRGRRTSGLEALARSRRARPGRRAPSWPRRAPSSRAARGAVSSTERSGSSGEQGGLGPAVHEPAHARPRGSRRGRSRCR